MTYHELLQIYFDRSNALQWYWTLYVVIIGGLLAFSSMRKERDVLTTALVTILFCFFAYKNLGAIQDTSFQRYAVRQAMQPAEAAGPAANRDAALIGPTLVAPPWPGIRNFHIASSALTVIAVWAMELRRMRAAPPPRPG